MKCVDLFAGSGGLTLGFEAAGYEVVAAYECWDAAIECYRSNFDHPVIKRDLSDSSAAAREIAKFEPDVIMGGPPCQDFSHAGKRAEGDRADLTEAFAKIVAAVMPRIFVMENVDRAAKSKAYLRARAMLVEAGYGLTERVLDASRCGAPQKRKRFICVGMLEEDDGFLNQTIDRLLSPSPMTIRDYFGEDLAIDHYYRHPRNYSRRAVFSVDEPSPTVRGVNRPVPSGYPGHPGDSAPVDDRIRALSTAERARVQTFPHDFVWVGSKTDVEQMIGNAVPVKLGEFVARAIASYCVEEGACRAS